MPTLEVVLERDRKRPSKQVSVKFVTIIHEKMLPWQSQTDSPVIDNSSMTTGQTLEAMEAALT